jgi:hypothetical protein
MDCGGGSGSPPVPPGEATRGSELYRINIVSTVFFFCHALALVNFHLSPVKTKSYDTLYVSKIKINKMCRSTIQFLYFTEAQRDAYVWYIDITTSFKLGRQSTH